jgi:hypothetical protein
MEPALQTMGRTGAARGVAQRASVYDTTGVIPAKIQAACPVGVARSAGTASLHSGLTNGQRG